MKRLVSILLPIALLISLTSCAANPSEAETPPVSSPSEPAPSATPSPSLTPEEPADPSEPPNEIPSPGGSQETTLLYQGHASLRLTSQNGLVLYIDPAEGEGYDKPADFILVTHEHNDHNKVSKVTQKDDCVIIRAVDILAAEDQKMQLNESIAIEGVQAYNPNHKVTECVGFIITIDDLTMYVAGDTSKTEQMDTFSERNLDYAFFPTDGVYNMSAEAAAECAEIVGAKHNIPYHTKVGSLFDLEIAESFNVTNRLIIQAGEEIGLE
ncbi:MAG: MBL fold metallo-hydrolase [Oscillospiraceae bacterium]|nr:MBL fold metallo-hydrolase [Oscillospiraceae bacterium]